MKKLPYKKFQLGSKVYDVHGWAKKKVDKKFIEDHTKIMVSIDGGKKYMLALKDIVGTHWTEFKILEH